MNKMLHFSISIQMVLVESKVQHTRLNQFYANFMHMKYNLQMIQWMLLPHYSVSHLFTWEMDPGNLRSFIDLISFTN